MLCTLIYTLLIPFSFITYRSCRHLDSKHSVFGRVVGGLDTINAMEKVETDKKDKPKVCVPYFISELILQILINLHNDIRYVRITFLKL